MREDRIVQRVRELADRVRITGRSLQLEPMILRTTPRSQCFQRRSGGRYLEPIRFGANQANYSSKAPAKKRGRTKSVGR